MGWSGQLTASSGLPAPGSKPRAADRLAPTCQAGQIIALDWSSKSDVRSDVRGEVCAGLEFSLPDSISVHSTVLVRLKGIASHSYQAHNYVSYLLSVTIMACTHRIKHSGFPCIAILGAANNVSNEHWT